MTARRRWVVRLSAAADRDLDEILRWTVRQFGKRQARTYSRTLASALEDLAAGPDAPGAKARDEIAAGLFTLRVARAGRKGRHFLLCRVGRAKDQPVIDVLRVLHEAMDLARHLTPGEQDADDDA